MSDEIVKENSDEPVVVIDKVHTLLEVEDRRAARDFKYWLAKVFSVTLVVLMVVCVLTLVYSAVVQEKDLNTTFVGDIFKAIFDFLHFLLA